MRLAIPPPTLSSWSLLLACAFQQPCDEAHGLSIHPPPHPQMSHHHRGRLPCTTSLPSSRSQHSSSHHSGLPHPRMPTEALPDLPPCDILPTQSLHSWLTGPLGLLKVVLLLLLLFIFYFWPCHVACGILVPQPGIEPVPPAMEARSPNHQTAREVPCGAAS